METKSSGYIVAVPSCKGIRPVSNFFIRFNPLRTRADLLIIACENVKYVNERGKKLKGQPPVFIPEVDQKRKGLGM